MVGKIIRKKCLMTIPDFIMTCGIPGSGKSSYILNHKGYKPIISPDMIRKELYGDISDQINNSVVWQRAIGRIEGILLVNRSVILDATNTKFSEWSEMIKLFKKCRKVVWLFKIDPSIACERIKKDIIDGKDRANVPEEVVYRHYGQLEYTIRKLPEYFDEIVEIS